MVDFIIGISGSGKTRVMAEAAVETAKISNGNVNFIDSGHRLLHMLPSDIRLINIDDYGIDSAMAFYGFLLGLCAGDYDLTDVFIDSATNIISNKKTNLSDFFEILSRLSSSCGVHFHFSVCDDETQELEYRHAV